MMIGRRRTVLGDMNEGLQGTSKCFMENEDELLKHELEKICGTGTQVCIQHRADWHLRPSLRLQRNVCISKAEVLYLFGGPIFLSRL